MLESPGNGRDQEGACPEENDEFRGEIRVLIEVYLSDLHSASILKPFPIIASVGVTI